MSLINRFPMLLVLIYASIFSLARSDTLLRKLSDDSDLSEFYGLLERNKIAMSSLEYRAVTLFVPTNQAFQRFTGNTTHILYHMSTVATTLEQLGSTIFSDLEGNPPLYITRKRDGSQEEIYVNNARILKSRSNIQAVNEQGKKQVMHVIDDVLVPLTTTPTSTNELYNPDAFQFLTNADSLEIGGHRIRSYRQRVIMMKKESVYQAVGGHTFLIPIEEGFRPSPRPDLIDKKVIDGHVIPHTVIFTSSAPMEQPMTTMAFEDNIKVSVSFFQQKDGPTTKTYVKSNTLIGDGKHSVGVVLAEIVKANIPVRNGVIHLIHRPLMIVDTTVIQFLKEKEDGPLYKFYEVIMDVGGQFMEDINNMSDVTILAPSNEAWNNPHVENVLSCPEERFEECLPNKEKMKEILNLHIIRGKMNVERIRQENHNSIAQIATNEPRKYLYFNIINNDGNETVTVEGGGVNATIIQADIAQTNGYVHIINNVLGIASSTVYEKISTDPMMNATYLLGKGTDFNKQLNDTSKRFTFFVPGEKAWARTATEYPSAHKKLFMKDFAYHARSILERHLVIADRVYTIGDLKPYENDSIVLNTMRDSLKIRVREQKNRNGYEIMWNNRWIQIYRPDVECTNGIIHVIDEPFLQESDIRVTGGTSQTQVTYNILFANFLMILIAKLLL